MFFKFICAVVTRSLFILVSLTGVWRVVYVKDNGLYWFLTILYLPLIAEMIVTLKRKRGSDYKWFSPAIFFFLISIIPSIWILELHHKQNNLSSRCKKLNSAENIQSVLNPLMNSTNSSEAFMTVLSSVCADDWILALHQILIVLLILGKWLLPAAGALSRDQLSQLLLIFVGTAADILEFTSETLSDIRDNSLDMVYIILAVWTWSMLQFPLHLSVMDASVEDLSPGPSLFSRLSAEIWSTLEALLIQDGPFLLVRLIVMLYFSVVHQMLIFFAIKNFLVVILNIYRLSVLVCDGSS
ncbi:transmembrane protein 26-like [Betta splendens]|uniref:Transmembrane protein 26-like n=1 Tax=Betta splendens TaxID=158456 RepID=A0A6P7L795_BETSP|nr:transmembrane protein 26-like [Betta splendens]XP_055360480.1 transmembrane protein 26-like [Betta splendens]